MDTTLQVMLAIGALSGWLPAIFGVWWFTSARRQRLNELSAADKRQRESLLNLGAEVERLVHNYREQLRQTRLLFEIEEHLAERLAQHEGGAARTKKTESRKAAVERLSNEIERNGHRTSPSGIRDRLQQLENFEAETRGILDSTLAANEGRSGPESLPAA